MDIDRVGELQAEFITYITDKKYHLNDKNLFALPTSIGRDELNEMLCNLLSIDRVKFSFYCYGMQITSSIAELLKVIEFKSEDVLSITYTLFDDSKPKDIVNLNRFITFMDYNSNLNQIVISSSDGMMCSIDHIKGKLVLDKRISDGEIASFDIKTSNNNITYLASISSYGHIEIAELSGLKNGYSSISQFKGHSNSGSGIRFDPNLTILATCGYDRAIRIFSLDNMDNISDDSRKRDSTGFYNMLENKSIYWGHLDAVIGIEYTTSDCINSISLDNSYKLWDVNLSKCTSSINLLKTPSSLNNNINNISAIGHVNGTISIYDNKSEECIFNGKLHSRVISDIKWNKKNDRIFATCSNDGTFTINDLRFNKSPIFIWKSDRVEFIRSCCWIDDKTLVIGSSNGSITSHGISNLNN